MDCSTLGFPVLHHLPEFVQFVYVHSVMPSNHLFLCRSLLLMTSIFPSIRGSSNESVLCIRWPKYWSFCFSISPSNEYSGLISFRIEWLYLLVVLKKEFIGPGLHHRPVCADRAWPPLQWTLNSVLSACGNAKGRIRPPSGQGNLEEEKTDTNHPCLRTVSIEM